MVGIKAFLTGSGYGHDLVHVILGIRPPAKKGGEVRIPRIAWTMKVFASTGLTCS
jgi:hypothetical protein